MNIVRRMSYRPGVMAFARSLHLTDLMRTAYYLWVTSGGGAATFKVAGAEGKFYVRTPQELRFFESYFTLERPFLEAILEVLSPGDVFYDVGCHVGKIAVPVARALGGKGRVVAFEPAGEFRSRLEAHLELNGVNNVDIFDVALGEADAAGELFVGGDTCPSLVRGASGGQGGPQRSERIDIVNGDSFRENLNLPVPRVIKIDVEGFEYSVIRGLQKTLADPVCELLCLEIHPKLLPAGVTPDAVISLIRQSGFCNINLENRVDEILVVAKKRTVA